MTMPSAAPQSAPPRGRRTAALRTIAAGLCGLGVALLVSCGSSGQGLIPASAAGPLRSDFEAVQQSAEAADGDCTTTEAALLKTEEDFKALPGSLDSGLRSTLSQGISNLRVRAHEMCAQPSAHTTTTTPATTTSTTPPTTTTTPPSTSTSTTTSTTPPTSTGRGGGTAAPGEEEAEAGKGKEHEGSGEGGAGGVGAGEPEVTK
jgi:hypothetical protein